MRSLLALVLAVLACPLATADDWTGKTIRVKEDGVKPGPTSGNGIVVGDTALDKGKAYTVKADDGTRLQLDAGWIFKFQAEVVADFKPFPKPLQPDEKVKTDGWFGKKVLPRRDSDTIRIGTWEDGKQVTWKANNLLNCTVREDRDGYLRVYDGRWEGWVSKDDMVTAEDAPAWWDKEVKANPNSHYGWFMRAASWKDKGEFDNAIKDYTEAIRLKPDSSAAYNGRGIAWGNKKEYDKAIADYTEALRLDPKDALAFSNRGNAWLAKKEYDKAVADYTEALRLDPKFTDAFNNRGNLWLRAKDYGKAIDDSNAALKLDPKSGIAFNNRAEAYAKLKKYDEAVAGFEKALEFNPMDGIYCAFAKFRASCPDAKYRDGKKAVELAKKAIEKAGKDADWEYLDALAMSFAEAGDFELAVAEQRKAVEMLKGEKFADKDDIKKAEARLELYRAEKPYRDDE